MAEGRSTKRKRAGGLGVVVVVVAVLLGSAACTTMPLPEDAFARAEVAALQKHFERDGRKHQLPFTVALARPEVPEAPPSGWRRGDEASAETPTSTRPAPAGAHAAGPGGGEAEADAERTFHSSSAAGMATSTPWKVDVDALGAEDQRGSVQAFDPAALQERFAEKLAALGVFRHVAALDAVEAAPTPEEGRDLLLAAAREARADLLLVPRFRRFDTSYVGMTGWWPVSWFLGVTLWWPSWFFPDERWAATVLLEWELVNLRTEKTIWSSTFPARVTAGMDDFDRGMDFPGPWGIPLFTQSFLGVEERNLAAVGEHLLPVALAQAEADFLEELGRRYRDLPDIRLDGAKAQTVALVIGVDRLARPAAHVPALACARQDALSFAEYLKRADGGGLGDERALVLLTDERATYAAVGEFLDVALRKLARGDSVVIYFAGYGATDARGNAYLVLHDTDPVTLRGALPLEKLVNAFQRRNVTVILDASFSGAGGRTLPPPPGQKPRTYTGKSLLAGARQQRQNYLVGACEPEGIAQEYEPEGHGVFTLLLLQALVEADGDDDERITLAEVMAWLEDRLPATSGVLGQSQTPLLYCAERADAATRVLAKRPARPAPAPPRGGPR